MTKDELAEKITEHQEAIETAKNEYFFANKKFELGDLVSIPVTDIHREEHRIWSQFMDEYDFEIYLRFWSRGLPDDFRVNQKDAILVQRCPD